MWLVFASYFLVKNPRRASKELLAALRHSLKSSAGNTWGFSGFIDFHTKLLYLPGLKNRYLIKHG